MPAETKSYDISFPKMSSFWPHGPWHKNSHLGSKSEEWKPILQVLQRKKSKNIQRKYYYLVHIIMFFLLQWWCCFTENTYFSSLGLSPFSSVFILPKGNIFGRRMKRKRTEYKSSDSTQQIFMIFFSSLFSKLWEKIFIRLCFQLYFLRLYTTFNCFLFQHVIYFCTIRI